MQFISLVRAWLRLHLTMPTDGTTYMAAALGSDLLGNVLGECLF